jgi:hypothetical protein
LLIFEAQYDTINQVKVFDVLTKKQLCNVSLIPRNNQNYCVLNGSVFFVEINCGKKNYTRVVICPREVYEARAVPVKVWG